jgi:membrane fusion protein (multidrug efflux system)
VDRYIPLAKQEAITQQDLDNATQNNLAAKAQVQAAKAQVETAHAQIQAANATIQAAKAAVDTAQLNLGFTRLTSPIDGIAGIAQQQVGALVNAASGAVTTVSTVNPIKCYFTVSEQEYLSFHRKYATQATLEAERKQLRLELILGDGTIYEHPGSFFFADRQVNESTGAIRIAGLFSNPSNTLRNAGGRVVGPATRRIGTARELAGRRRRTWKQNRYPSGQDRTPLGKYVGHRPGLETRRDRGG